MSWINIKIWTISTKFHYPYEWIFGKASPWPSYIIKEVTWNWYINLTNAVANHLMELKAYGWTMQWVPSWYTMTEWTRNATWTRVQTWIIADVDDMVIEVDCDAILGSFYLIQNRTSDDKIFGITWASSWAKIQLNFWTTNPFLTSTISRVDGNRYLIRASWKNWNGSLYVKDFVNNVEDTQTWTYTWSAQTDELNVFYSKSGGASLSQWCEIRSLKIWKQDVLVLNYIPCKDSNNKAYFYDTVSKKIVSQTLWNLVAWPVVVPTPTAPIDIVSNNGVIKVRRQSGLPINYQMVEWIKSTGSIAITGFKTKSTQEITTVLYREAAGSAYLYVSDSTTSGTTNTTAYLSSWNGNWRWDGRAVSINVPYRTKITSVQSADGVYINDTEYSYTKPGKFVSTNDLRISSNENTTVRIYSITIRGGETVILDLVPVQRLSDSTYGFYDKVSGNFYTNSEATFVAGDTISDPVEIYADWTTETISSTLNTATAEMLLKVGDYADEQEILSWNITRKIGVKVLDGTEDWMYSAGYSDTETNACFYIPTGASTIPILPQTGTSVECLCSHFRWVSRNDVYNNKTPIVGAITGSASEERVGISITLRVPLSIANTSATDFKQFLADQYNAWTPVIIVYPLAEPTTETVAGQTMNIPAGDSTIEITQASLDDLELSAKYKALP